MSYTSTVLLMCAAVVLATLIFGLVVSFHDVIKNGSKSDDTSQTIVGLISFLSIFFGLAWVLNHIINYIFY